MEKLLDHISAYELLNNLIPGAVLYSLICRHTGCRLIDNVLLEMAACYFVGLVAGRFGSLVIEPLFKKFKFIEMRAYGEFIAASKIDPKIETLSGVCNMYRTFAAIFVLYAVWRVLDLMIDSFPTLRPWIHGTGLLLLILLFCFSYRKQANYVARRVEAHQGDKNEEKADKM